jgi:putative phosphoribosyl transferase
MSISSESWAWPEPLFADRAAAGRLLATELEDEREDDAVVVGLARGGVVVAAEVAKALGLPLDAVAVRKVGHPWQPEYAIGAVAPGDGAYIRAHDGLTDQEVAAVVAATREKAAELDSRLHAEHPALELAGHPCILVDDGLATGATMIAAARWARARGASRVVAVAPVGAKATAELVRCEADAVVCQHRPEAFFAVGPCYRVFGQVEDEAVVRLLAAGRAANAPVT